jgi:hypothetical protein
MIGSWRFGLAHGLDAEVMSGCTLLSAAVIFFLLKLFGLRCLRLRLTRRGWIAVCLVVALIHLDCVRPGLRAEVVSKCGVALMTVPAVLAVSKVVRGDRATFQRHRATHKSRPPDGWPMWLAWGDGFRPHDRILACLSLHLRAPPA